MTRSLKWWQVRVRQAVETGQLSFKRTIVRLRSSVGRLRREVVTEVDGGSVIVDAASTDCSVVVWWSLKM